MAARFVFRTGAATDVGKLRKLNEDSLIARPEIGLWAIADGMGGHAGGDIASRAVVAALGALAKPASAAALLADFERAVGETNLELRRLARQRGNAVIGSTLAAVLIFDEHFACVWCGDSRVYLLRDGALKQVSRDHSEVQDLIDRGVLDRDEAKTWPRRNVVTRALGVVDEPELEISDGRALPGDRFLLCSDGLTGHVADDEIAGPLAAEDPQKACDALIALTLQRGASDNVSVVIVICDAMDRTVRDDGAWRRAIVAQGETNGR
jgi:protein phosphatase